MKNENKKCQSWKAKVATATTWKYIQSHTKRNNWLNSSSRAINENRAAKYWSYTQYTSQCHLLWMFKQI